MTDNAAMSPEPLSRARIIRAAIALIERDGADAVSMRRIAAELGVGVMSLYNHVPNKAALLNGVAETVLSEIEFTDDPGAYWTERVREQARAFRRIAHHYPRCTMLVVGRKLPATAALPPVERALATLRGAGFDGQDAVRIMRMFIAYVVGSVLREVRATPAFVDEEFPPAETDLSLFPESAALAPILNRNDHDADFEFGLELLVRAVAFLPRGRGAASPASAPVGRHDAENVDEHVTEPAAGPASGGTGG
ncbi:DNA-binding transcriptional regulator, AcrR family [Thermostaphylospora chromogena]|uniref:DNA-binding transcriptional regulator, AcrR family n=2 Tax=Thermostaphylospora chromogena TaxID=35622 RepID=A0A1H1HUU1_9ACTN|nr:DNA-binding transcriptional regulator, AcrR family [Thermostaphylospora chromogena]